MGSSGELAPVQARRSLAITLAGALGFGAGAGSSSGITGVTWGVTRLVGLMASALNACLASVLAGACGAGAASWGVDLAGCGGSDFVTSARPVVSHPPLSTWQKPLRAGPAFSSHMAIALRLAAT